MYKEVLRSIEGVDIYPIISLALFFILFSVITIQVFLLKKTDINEVARLPLNSDDLTENEMTKGL